MYQICLSSVELDNWVENLVSITREVMPVENEGVRIELTSLYKDQILTGPVEAGPVEAGAVEADPVDAEPVEAEPIEAKPVEAKPVKSGQAVGDPR
ncbi:hypothetical protein OUZ56_016724 [Daphnia magna]|uniref:PH domain-containing protein n=1 Tax=Daphnia magna TaxID=35525 RepID=A0ABR0ARD1_9CRUS|nr:hypothetical protein OUZ56_016724 [Daphnia magna]